MLEKSKQLNTANIPSHVIIVIELSSDSVYYFRSARIDPKKLLASYTRIELFTANSKDDSFVRTMFIRHQFTTYSWSYLFNTTDIDK